MSLADTPYLLFLFAISCMTALLSLSHWYMRKDATVTQLPPVLPAPTQDAATNPEMEAVLNLLRPVRKAVRAVPRRQRLGVVRQQMDAMFANRPLDAWFRPVDAAGVPAQWVQAPGSDENRRLLYLHGGAFYAGSADSHRTITSKLSAITGCAVLAINYRLMPEHSRMDGIQDTRAAYHWMLHNGPGDNFANTPAQTVFVAGDSAGGNLTLSLLLWLRDQGLRTPDAAVALSPVTDLSLNSPSLRSNQKSDWMLGPLFQLLLKLPSPVRLGMGLYRNRMLPKNPLLSPLYGELSGLPPVLLHASTSEVLLDDARRFANKALAAGSPVTLQTWSGMPHVWHIFNPELPQAEQAFTEIALFLQRHGPRRRGQRQAAQAPQATPAPHAAADRASASALP